MIFTFRLVSDEVANFKREIKIDATATFLDLKNAICDATGYNKNELTSFFMCNRDWEKTKEITTEDMGLDNDEDIWLMDSSVLEDFIYDEGQKMLYVFDYLTDRVFFMEMVTSEPGKNLKDPICTLSIGKAPDETMDIDSMPAPAPSATTIDIDIDAETYGSEAYNEDEFDEEGYTEINNDGF